MIARMLMGALLVAPLPADAWFTSNVRESGAGVPSEGSELDATSSQRWVLRAGYPLSEELKRVARDDGWAFRWELPYDYRVEVDIPLSGSIDEKLRTLVRAYQARGEMAGVSPYTSSVNRVASVGVIDMGVRK